MDTLEVMLGQIGGNVESLHIMVLPMLIENAERLEELFNALDAMQTEVLPQVTETLGECGTSSCHSRLEGIADLKPPPTCVPSLFPSCGVTYPDCFEASVTELERRRANLDPSSYRKMMKSITSGFRFLASEQGLGSGGALPPPNKG